MLFEIKNRFNGAVIFSLETESMKLCVEAAVKARINLSSADLYSANLSSADLSSANLSSANLISADLRSANLISAYLYSADLSSADLNSANLSFANLHSANLSSAKYGYGVPLENKPVQLDSNKYYVLIMDTHIKIGCKLYKHTEWESFTDAEISKMDNGALEWWNEWRGMILSLSLGHQQRIAKLKN